MASILQTLSASLFFILIARFYTVSEFGNFILATTLSQIVVAFSTLGLGQWFIREYLNINDKPLFIAKFLKIQFILGVIFYALNFSVAYFLYEDVNLLTFSLILGFNIVFDNIIFALSRLNIAEGNQKRTAIVMALDGILRLGLSGILFIYPLSLIMLSLFLIVIRIITLNIFIKLSASYDLGIALVAKQVIKVGDFLRIVISNWRFIVIGTVYILNWRLANIIISKNLTLQEVGEYEICFRLLTLALIIPTITVSTIFPIFINLFRSSKREQLLNLYKFFSSILQVYSMLGFAFVLSFGSDVVRIAFGFEYISSAPVLQVIFGCLFFTSTASLQANFLVAMNLEGLDMKLNLYALIINIMGAVIGLHYIKSIMVPVYSLLASVIIFHLLQDIILVRKGVVKSTSVFKFYVTAIIYFSSCLVIASFNSRLVFYMVILFFGFLSPLIFRRLRYGFKLFSSERKLYVTNSSF